MPAYQIVEAIRTGPGNMPRFTGNLSDKQVNDVTQYVVTEIQHPNNPGRFLVSVDSDQSRKASLDS